jgi:tellurite resistance protein
VSNVLLGLGGASWLVALAAYLAHAQTDHDTITHDLNDHAAAPFLSLAAITPMLLGAQLLYPHAAAAGTIVVDVFLVLTVTLGAWLTGQWVYLPLSIDDLHPGYFLPTVAGGLLAATSAAAIGQRRLAVAMFGLGLICWLVLGSIILNRLFTRPLPADALLPTLAVEVAPPAVASIAWFALHGAHIDTVAELLGGYGLLMALAQLRLLPAYVRLPFRPSIWAFTFSWAAAASTALVWLEVLRPAGYRGWQFVVLTAISLLVGGIGARTLIALGHRDLLPPTGGIPMPSEPSSHQSERNTPTMEHMS